jgi:conjugal transfer pilus assembly protein TraB
MTEVQRAKYKQIALLIGLLTCLTLVFYIFIKWSVGGKEGVSAKRPIINSIPSITKNVDDSGVWMQRMEGKLSAADKRNGDLERQLLEQRAQLEQMAQGQQQILNEITNKLNVMVEQSNNIQQLQSKEDLSSPQSSSPQSMNSWPPNENFSATATADTGAGSTIYATVLSLSDKNRNLKNKDNYIPAGSFVRAVVLGGVDASASITSQTEPRPMLLRLVDLGFLPNNARTNIQDCHIVAAAHGDISSERAYIRTERMSCTLKNGKIFESTLDGYIAGEDGKDGIRGKVIRREGDLLLNSFFAGTVAGLGKGMSQSIGTT